MKFIFFTLLFIQFFYINVNAEKINEILEENKFSKTQSKSNKKGNVFKLNQIIWKSYNDDESYFDNFDEDRHINTKTQTNDQNKSIKIIWKSYKKDKNIDEQLKTNPNFQDKKTLDQIFYEAFYKDNKKLTQINSFLPLNNFINYDEYQATVEWKSSFGGGKAGGTGQQNNSFKLDYGLSEDSLLTIYFSEADDDTYNHIKGKRAQYFWQNYAISLKKKLLNENKWKFDLSLASSLEYWRHSSGSENSKSIYNEFDDALGKDKFENIIGSFSLPFSKKIGENLSIVAVPGVTFLPDKLGQRTNRKNSYGNNFYLGTGLTLDIYESFNIIASYTNPLGPGSNYFDKDLNFSNRSIYSYGFHWSINPMIGLEGKITNSYGSTPALGILTIPSDDLPLYSINFIYNPSAMDTIIEPLNNRDKLISFGGLTVNNALLPESGTSQLGLNYDSKGNLFGQYSYSLSNIFQLELVNAGTFKDVNSTSNRNHQIRDTYLGKDNFNFRLGGKLLLFSPQKGDLFWGSIRASVGRNQDTNQGYLYSELINTFKVNDSISLNFSPKYFLSGVDSFAAFGFSTYITFSENIQLIPEINTLFNENSEFNSTIALRYSYDDNRSIDLYYSNAIGLQDLGQILKGKGNRLGIRLNYRF